ncbi:MAG: fluoride efflux transporter CrcB [Gammaproteobacteria bacterium]|jgi:CrcB protein|nr:fluoride efflux transporter CrcB [Gammaproteobacteria bacterium]MBT5217637.1 fluoride efflux transporter CrcB [Gammaproteobacteria bacterium]MBT5541682.1 fluoride efflux transporter CrcB [Gammaproteobacteria bacterium]
MEILKLSIWIGIGGFFGTILRFLSTALIEKAVPLSAIPLGTFFVNIIGCLFIGLFAGYFSNKISEPTSFYMFIAIGVLGGYTTFSAFAFEAQLFIQNGELLKLVLYIASQVIIGVLLALLGYNIIRV